MKLLNLLVPIAIALTVPGLAQDFSFYPGEVSYDGTVPTLRDIVGHAWGEKITTHAELERYLRALASASKNVQLVEYGRTWEDRALYYLIIASEANMARLPEIKTGIGNLADPRELSDAQAGELVKSLPVITWLAYAVHGNEISSTDAALLTGYHLAAAENDTLAANVLSHSIVLIDPLQNPDGRDRFVNYFRQTRGRWADAEQLASEHNEDWPGGRTNHYFFDLNRDWFPLTQPESRGKVKAYLEWYPHVYVDLHEMGSNNSYFFPPTPLPINPNVAPSQLTWLAAFGRNNAKWFDRMRFDFFTREVFDAFYPGYGVSWPTLNGAVGMTYEQASTRGLVVLRDDKTTMHYRDAVQHHFISSLATAANAARNREAMVQSFYDYRKSAILQGSSEAVKEFIITPAGDRKRAHDLAANLLAQGIEVKRATAEFSNSNVRDYYSTTMFTKQFPAGTYIVSMAQPAKHLVKAMLAHETPMDSHFVEEQKRRYKKHMSDQIYDITAWSLPLLYDVDAYMAGVASRGSFEVITDLPPMQGEVSGGRASLAYLIPWGSHASAEALALLHRREIRVYATDKAMTLQGEIFPRGSLIVKVKDNPKDLHQQLEQIAQETGAAITATNSSWVEEGVNFGSNNVHFLEKPRIALAYQVPTNAYSLGWVRYIIEQEYGYPVTVVNTQQFGRFELSKYNVIILPSSSGRFGDYSSAMGDGGVRKLKAWVDDGGTLITFQEATHWLTDKKVDLLATAREYKGGRTENDDEKKSKTAKKTEDEDKPFDVEEAIQPERELPAAIPGAILRVQLDGEHWLAFGYPKDKANVLVSSRNIFRPIKLDRGRNVGLYMPENEVLVSGFAWDDVKKQIANKAFLMHQPRGRGHVVAFAEDPNYRAFMHGLNLLLMNAIFFGPAH